MRIITIGDPNQTATGANAAIDAVFADAVFPLMVKLTNHAPQNRVLSELDVFLGPDTTEAASAVAIVSNLELLHRVASSCEQIAALNRHAKAVTIEEVEVSADPMLEPAKSRASRKAPAAQQDALPIEMEQPQ